MTLVRLSPKRNHGSKEVWWKSKAEVFRGSLFPGLLKLAIGKWNVTSRVGKEPKLEQEVERY